MPRLAIALLLTIYITTFAADAGFTAIKPREFLTELLDDILSPQSRTTPVKVNVIYCGGCGYRPKYERLKNDISQRFPGADIECEGEGTPEVTGFLEVSVNGHLVHSKKNGDGYVDSNAKLQKILDAISQALHQ